MCNVQRVIDINVSVGICCQGVEDMRLERVGRFHDEGVEIEPPEPKQSLAGRKGLTSQRVRLYHSAFGYFRMQFRMMSTFSQLSLHS